MELSQPLHPPTVHFPIAYYILAVLLTAGYLWQGRAEFDRFAGWSLLLAWGGTLLAMLSGLVDQNRLALDDPRRAAVNNHITGAVLLFVITGLLLYMRLRWPDALNSHRRAYLGLLGLGLLAILYTAWSGGHLVYNLGIGPP